MPGTGMLDVHSPSRMGMIHVIAVYVAASETTTSSSKFESETDSAMVVVDRDSEEHRGRMVVWPTWQMCQALPCRPPPSGNSQ